MKRLPVLVLVLALVAGLASAQTFDQFKTTFVGFADSMAGGLNLNSTIGNTWSDSYLGGFPHLGAGLVLGSTFAGQAATDELFALFGEFPPTGLDKLGVPIPAVAAMAKIGIPFLPIDVGLKAGLIPADLGAKLEAATGVKAEYKNVGLSLRYALVKEKLLLPDIAFGLSGNFVSGKVSAPIGSGQSLSDGTNTLTFTQPMIGLEWETKTLDATLQVSKTLLFIRPYAGIGYTIGTSTVKGGLDSDMSYTGPDEAAFMAALEAQGYAFTDTGFSYSTENSDPTLRVYGGVSLSLLITLDAQLMYVPATENLGGSISARIQL